MMLMRILLLGTMIGLVTPAAFACGAQKGKVLYEDKFNDDSGGWFITPDMKVNAPGLNVTVPPNGAKVHLNSTFNFTDGDYCIRFAFPNPLENNTDTYATMRVISTDDINGDYYDITLYLSGGFSLSRSLASEPTTHTIFKTDEKSLENLTPGAFNDIEAVVKDSTISIVLNGNLVKSIRVQIPDNHSYFGFTMAAGSGYTSPAVFKVESVSVTEVR